MKNTTKTLPSTAKRAAAATALIAAIALAGPTAPARADTAPDREDVQEQLAEIGERYEVGDVLTPQDAELIESAAMPVGAGSARAASFANCFRKTKTGASNGSGTVDGCHGFRMGPNVINNNWMVGYTATGNRNVTKIRAAEHVRAYGLVGSSGLGLVYSANPSATVNGRTHKFSRSAAFKALAAYMTVSYDVTFSTSRGSFNVSGG